MSAVAHVLGENVTGVDVPRDVAYVHLFGMDAVANRAVFEIDVAHAFGASGFGAVDCPLVVVVQASGADGVGEVHVVAAVSNEEDFLHRLVGCADLCLAC